MRFFLGLLVAAGIGFVILTFAGGYTSFDPSEKGLKAKAALTPGMSFDQACDLSGDPKKFRIINRKVRTERGREIVTMVPSPEVKTSRERIKERLNEGSLPYGFICTFLYSADVAFDVQYDDTGAVKQVYDVKTMANMMWE